MNWPKIFYVSPEDDYHVRINSEEYFEILFDDNKFKEFDKNMTSKDPLEFEDSKKYIDRLKSAQEKNRSQRCRAHRRGKKYGQRDRNRCDGF